YGDTTTIHPGAGRRQGCQRISNRGDTRIDLAGHRRPAQGDVPGDVQIRGFHHWTAITASGGRVARIDLDVRIPHVYVDGSLHIERTRGGWRKNQDSGVAVATFGNHRR